MTRTLRAAGCLTLIATLHGCGGTPVMEDPMRVMADDQQPSRVREEAISQARTLAGDDPVAVSAVTQEMEAVIASGKVATEVRLAAMRSMIADKDPAVRDRARALVRTRLPTETSPPMVALMCSAAGENGWTDCLGAIVRSYARPNAPATTEEERPERAAITALSPGMPLEQAVAAVFTAPAEAEAIHGVDWTARTQRDAWHVLCRLDPSGDFRRTLLTQTDTANDRGAAALETLRACEADLRATPNSGDELAWLLSLRESRAEGAGAWWKSASAAAAKAPQGERLSLRHAEPLRSAGEKQPAWLSMSRDQLIALLAERLADRTIRERGGSSKLYRESLSGQESRLTWADCITALVIDDALREPGNANLLWQQAELDREDTRSMFGGAWMPRRDGSGYIPVLYPPRPAQRRGDLVFVPTTDMISQSDRALAFYSFHAQQVRNEGMAGPAPEEMDRITRMGRNEVIATMLAQGRLNVDVIFPNNIVLDLGVIETTTRRSHHPQREQSPP